MDILKRRRVEDFDFAVTDLFGEDGFCRVAVEHNGETIYFKIEGGKAEGAVPGSFAYSSSTGTPVDEGDYEVVK